MTLHLAPLLPEEFANIINVSRETLDRLILFTELLGKWQKSINLVGKQSMPDLWRRHILDSAQLVRHIPEGARVITDLGTGAGFPGMILALLLDIEINLVESSGKKITFLREAARITGAPVSLYHGRIEKIRPPKGNLIVARALAPLDKLLGLAAPHLAPGGACLFLKGRTVDEELTTALKNWKMHVQQFPSATDASGKIMLIQDITLV